MISISPKMVLDFSIPQTEGNEEFIFEFLPWCICQYLPLTFPQHSHLQPSWTKSCAALCLMFLKEKGTCNNYFKINTKGTSTVFFGLIRTRMKSFLYTGLPMSCCKVWASEEACDHWMKWRPCLPPPLSASAQRAVNHSHHSTMTTAKRHEISAPSRNIAWAIKARGLASAAPVLGAALPPFWHAVMVVWVHMPLLGCSQSGNAAALATWL